MTVSLSHTPHTPNTPSWGVDAPHCKGWPSVGQTAATPGPHALVPLPHCCTHPVVLGVQPCSSQSAAPASAVAHHHHHQQLVQCAVSAAAASASAACWQCPLAAAAALRWLPSACFLGPPEGVHAPHDQRPPCHWEAPVDTKTGRGAGGITEGVCMPINEPWVARLHLGTLQAVSSCHKSHHQQGGGASVCYACSAKWLPA